MRMVKFDAVKDLDFEKLMEVYAQSNRENAEDMFPEESPELGLLHVEQGFGSYLREDFFKVPGAAYYVLTEGDCYLSALRLEPYLDGLLLEALETRPNRRRQGFAAELIRGVLNTVSCPVYSHVSRRNKASLAVHMACGFREVLDYAEYVDGTVNANAVTLRADSLLQIGKNVVR